jgi:hypothetical protein
MKEYKRSLNQQKIIDSMTKVYEKLIEFKKKSYSELIIMKDNKIVSVKPKRKSPKRGFFNTYISSIIYSDTFFFSNTIHKTDRLSSHQ